MTERIEPPGTGTERDQLVTFLDYYRATLLLKAEGLTDDQAMAKSCPPSTLSIVGLVRHMAEVERWWFDVWWLDRSAEALYCTDAEPDGDLLPSAAVSLAEARATLIDEIARSNQRIAAAEDLDQLAAHAQVTPYPDRPAGWQPNMRWILIHMIEEYARHCGHADLLRESIDGLTGD